MDWEKDSTIRLVTRFTTLIVLRQLNAKRREEMIQALHESDLIKIDHLNRTEPVIDLTFGFLRDPDLTLDDHNFQHHLIDAYISQTDLTGASFRRMNVARVTFDKALMNDADLSLFSAYESGVLCRNGYTSSRGTWLMNAPFNNTAYHFADFTSAKMTKGQLQLASILLCRMFLYHFRFCTTRFVDTHMVRENASRIEFDECHFNKFDCLSCSRHDSVISYSNLNVSNMAGSTIVNSRIHATKFVVINMRSMDSSHAQNL